MTMLVPIHSADFAGETVPTVDARELHAYLKVARDFSTWIKDRIERYGFVEGEDYVKIDSPNLGNQNGRGGDRRSIDYHLTLDMAKELSMVENNPQGRRARRYFIEAEKRLREGGGRLAVESRPNSAFLPRLTEDFRSAKDLALLAGIDGDQAILSANRAVYEIHGISVLKLLGADHRFPDAPQEAGRGERHDPSSLHVSTGTSPSSGAARAVSVPRAAASMPPDAPTPRARPASHPLPLQLRTDTYAPFIERALAARAERERIEQETGRRPSVREHAAALQAQGYRASLSLLNWFNYAVDALLPAIPEALRAGMGKPQVQRLRALERDLETAREDGYGAVRLTFQRLLARHDGPALDLDAITAEVERILSPGADH